MENELSQVNVLIDRANPTSSGRFYAAHVVLEPGKSELPKTISEFMRWVRRMQNIVAALARTLGAESYSLGVSMPIGVSFNLSFPTYK